MPAFHRRGQCRRARPRDLPEDRAAAAARRRTRVAGARCARPGPAGAGGANRSGRHSLRRRPGRPGTQETGQGKRDRPELPTSARPGVLPSGALLTTEPGGQLELSSQPADSLAGLVRATSADLAALREALAAAGLELAGIGLDPLRPPRRVLTLPRYAAMEAFFDADGPWGRQMMCGTASVQVCLDAGDDSDGPAGYRRRWRLLHAIGPVLVAAFANSPLRDGKPTGWVSSRQQVWAGMDPGRTRPPDLNGDPRAAWAAYALDAQVMCVRDPDSADWSAPPGLTFSDWVRPRRDGGAARRAAAAAHRRRPRIPPVHAVPAGPAARALRAAHDRRAARRRLDRAARGVERAPVRRPGRGRRARRCRADLERAPPGWPTSATASDYRRPRRRGAVDPRRPAAGPPTRRSAGPAGNASRPPGKPWTAWPSLPGSRRPLTPSPSST